MLGHRTNFKFLILGMLVLGLQACTQTIDGGSIEKTFSGVDQALVLGPNAVELNWTMNSKCEEYEIFVLSTSTSESAAKVTLPPYRFKTLNEGSPYKFAVGCVQTNGVNGQDTVLSANTWQKFSGNIQSKLNETGSVLELKWNYPNFGTIFSVYAKEQKVPGDLSDWALPTISGKTGYNDTPICVTGSNMVRIGPGGDCIPAKTLDSGKTYHFKVVAQYPDGTFSNDIKGNGTTIEKPADFKPPNCSLTQTGFGSDVDSTYLYLRCFTGSTCSGVLDVQAFQNGEQVSDKMEVSSGLLTIKPKPIPGSANNRKVEGLELHFGCTIPGKTNLSVVRYDDSKTALKKPSMKFGDSDYEAASPLASEKFPSNMGMASVVGDFNCNGKPDIAFGLPNVTYNQPPYYNRNGGSGLVKVIYDYATSATGSYIETPESTQYITFRDLPSSARFGQSLSAGNINRDVYVDTSDEGRIYGCDDLIISAPGINGASLNATSSSNGITFTGAVYVFYGQRQKFPRPLDSSSLPLNMPSCSGSISNQICSPVRLSPDVMTWLKVDPRYSSQQTVDNRASSSTYNSASSFGYSVSFIRDFNADGYGDLAIGDPFCDWDGEVTNGVRGSNGDRVTIRQVGCVYVYWGGPSGIQSLKMGKLPDGTTDLVSPFAKIYPPFPRWGMHFGASISNGGEVDNRPPVPIKMNDNKNVVLANGSDFMVGAPDFQYAPSYSLNGANVTTDTAAGTLEGSPNWTVTDPTSGYGGCTGVNCPVDPQVARSMEIGFATVSAQRNPSSKNVKPWNGAWNPTLWTNASWGAPTPTQVNLRNSTGIAFLFRGRSPLRSYDLRADQGFTKFPKNVTETNLDSSSFGTLETILNDNYNSRSNGSKYLKLSSTDWGTNDENEWQLNPVDSFYNCGNRGSPRSPSAAPDDYVTSDLTRYPGLYKHVSCLAGRNNFSVIYPALKTTDAAVSQFGLKVQISGGSDQNAIALFEYQGYKYAYQSVNDTLISFTPGKLIQPTIRGSNLWEMGIQGLSVPGVFSSSDQFTSGGNKTFSPNDSTAYVGSVVHSPISESYSLPTLFSVGVVNPVFNTDINRDGYADVSVTAEYTDGTQTKSKLYTYFGNYAADFQATDYTSTNSCVVNRLSNYNSTTDAFKTALPNPGSATITSGNNGAIEPYTTFRAEATVSTDGTVGFGKITYEFPETFVPTNANGAKHARLSYLDDVSEIATSALDYNYQTINRTGTLGAKSLAANRCKPQVSNQFTSSINALSSADLNNDGLTDLVIGMSGASSNQGLTYVYYAKNDASSTAHGLSSYTQYIKSAANELNGSSVSATNWLFTDNTSRRDLFSGARGHDNGAGAVYQFSASGNQSISTAASNPIKDNSNSPNNLSVEWSKVIGDVNGDGRADILVPLKLVSAVGSNYYDALIYFGSPFGPITYSYCMSHLSVIKNLNGSPIAASDCLGSVNFVQAKIDGETEVVSLPMRIEKQSGFSYNWVFNAYEAGDVNRDGFDDMVIFDYGSNSTLSNRGMYLFFGSSSGVMNGSPQRTSNSTDPQIVTTESAYLNFVSPLSKIGYHANSPWSSTDSYLTGNNGGNYQNFPIKHGDFNGDGFEDLAFAIYVSPSGSNNDWNCGDADRVDVGMCLNGALDVTKKQSPGGSDSAVAVLYGSAKGYQTPSNTTDQLNDDFDSNLSMTNCPNFYGNSNGASESNTCNYTATGNASLKYVKEVYDTLGSDQATGWFINTKRTACNPSNGTCKGQVIRRPDFYNITSGGGANIYSAGRGWWIFMAGRFGFGTTLTVADTNNDGIDDLVVSDTGYWMPGFDDGSPNSTVFHLPGDTTKGNASRTGNSRAQGRAYIYYGAQGAGLVAPNAFNMLGDVGLGLSIAGTSMKAGDSMPPFALYPMVSTKAGLSMNNSPALEKITLNTINFSPYLEGYTRQFGINTTAGDFNGDGFDDLAVTTAYGQAYVYYGPICQLDNDKDIWTESYKSINNNLAIRMDMSAKGIASTRCSKFNLKFASPLTSDTAKVDIDDPTTVSKSMYPQVMTIPGVTADKNFGALLLSKRPKRSVASVSIISNPGNIDNDPEGTSDLVIGSAYMQDPNVAPTLGTQTGVAYVLFGHKDGSSNSIKSNPGLWYGTPGYTSALLSEKCSASSSEDCYYHQPIYLRGYSADGLVGRFFSQEVSIGDLNGDKSGDLILPTIDYQNGYLKTDTLQNMSVVNGGGLKLVY